MELADFKARLPILSIVQRYVKMRRAGSVWQGRCPFHNEKTPSFTVTEARGTYHCFGCGVHGNSIDFLMEIENLTFQEAVQRAAELVGLPAPVFSGAAQVRPQPKAEETDLLEAAAGWFRRQLAGAEGDEARAYVAQRGLLAKAVSTFELGWAPPAKDALTRALLGEGAAASALLDLGLSVVPEGQTQPIDRFRGRLMFPIRDRRGRLVGFGGRALRSDAKAKYLNSPETPVFRKRELLYGADRVRSFGRGAMVHLVEGYMDVIALAQAGVPAVAPLGTAVTELQLLELWRLADTPVVCLDGDQAGRRAASRLAELAVEHVQAGKTLAFVEMPEGEDPDSLVRTGGAAALREVTDRRRSLLATLWAGLVAEIGSHEPEARALLKKRARAVVRRIKDPDVRAEYGAAIAAQLGGDERPSASGFGSRASSALRVGGARIAPSTVQSVQRRSGWLLLKPVIDHPETLCGVLDELAAMDLLDPGLEGLKSELIAHLVDEIAADRPLETDKIISHLQVSGHSAVLNALLADTVCEPLDVLSVGSIEEAYRMRLEQAARWRRRESSRTDLSIAAASSDPSDWQGEQAAVSGELNANARTNHGRRVT